jgi:uncharacterized membrane protein
MFDSVILGLLKNKWTWIILIAIVLGIWVYNLYQENQRLQFQNDVHRQNEQALKDSLDRHKDSIQVLAAKVADLNNESSDWKNKYVAIKTKYEIAIDSLIDHGDGITETTDSTARVVFAGSRGIATYSGWTLANVKTKESSWDIGITFADILAQSEIFRDKTDDLWKIKTTSMTSGVKLRGLTTIDESILRQIRTIPGEESNSRFAIGTEVQRDRVYGGLFIRPSNWMFGIQYMLYDNSSKEYQWNDRVKISIYYFLF